MKNAKLSALNAQMLLIIAERDRLKDRVAELAQIAVDAQDECETLRKVLRMIVDDVDAGLPYTVLSAARHLLDTTGKTV